MTDTPEILSPADFPDFDFSDFEIDADALDMDAFDISGLATDPLPECRYLRPKLKAVKHRLVRYERAEELADAVQIEKGARWDALVSGHFIFGDFLEAFLVRNNAICPRVTISMLSLSQNNVDSLFTLMDKGYIQNLDMILSHYFFSHERGGLIPYIYKRLDIGDRFQLAVARVHTKLVLIETLGGKKIVISGSANLRSSGNIEQMTIEESPELYDFYLRELSGVISQTWTINKAIADRRVDFSRIYQLNKRKRK